MPENNHPPPPPAPGKRLTASRLLTALAYVFAGLLGRALIDRLLAVQGGAVAVAGWAQLSSLAEVVSGVSLAGVGTALTVVAAGRSGREQLAWLKPALLICLVISLTVALALPFLLVGHKAPLVPGDASLVPLALVAGGLAVAPGLLVALLLGIGRPGRATAVLAMGFVPPLLLLFWRPTASPLLDLLVGQGIFGLTVASGLVLLLRGQPPLTRQSFDTLLRFVPAGLAIGILSPAATAWARAEMAANLSWDAAGHVQAIWRTSDWITAIMAGLLNAHFLPRLSAAAEGPAFLAELKRSARGTLLPAAFLLSVLGLFLPQAMALLYRTNIVVAREDALFFLLGDWVRILSWVPLMGLFARRAAWAITVGEFFSLPLFALLLTVFGQRFGLREVGMAWFATYATYACLNGALLWRSMKSA